VDIHVSNVRRKLRAALGAEPPIETVRGVGYRLRTSPGAGADQTSPLAHGGAPETDLGRLALAALARAPTPLLMLSPDRTVLLYNEAAEQLCGWTAEEVAGQVKCYSLLGCHDANGGLLCHGRCALRDGALRNTSEHQARYVITLKDGRELPVSAHYSRLSTDDVDGAESGYTLLALQPEV
jgi:PAS domain S-box-containing protein